VRRPSSCAPTVARTPAAFPLSIARAPGGRPLRWSSLSRSSPYCDELYTPSNRDVPPTPTDDDSNFDDSVSESAHTVAARQWTENGTSEDTIAAIPPHIRRQGLRTACRRDGRRRIPKRSTAHVLQGRYHLVVSRGIREDRARAVRH